MLIYNLGYNIDKYPFSCLLLFIHIKDFAKNFHYTTLCLYRINRKLRDATHSRDSSLILTVTHRLS